jgi:hypothetical protein
MDGELAGQGNFPAGGLDLIQQFYGDDRRIVHPGQWHQGHHLSRLQLAELFEQGFHTWQGGCRLGNLTQRFFPVRPDKK